MKSYLAVFSNKRMLATLLLGFSSGIPLALTAGTLQAWMKTENIDLTVIGVFGLVALPYSLKFLWAPLLDRYHPPIFRGLGRRRGWILIFQIALIAMLSLMAISDFNDHAWMFAWIAFAVAFLSASQDVVVDALRNEMLTKSEYGAGAAVTQLGYRGAMLFSGAFALVLSDRMSWQSVYFIMAAAILIGVAGTIIAREPKNIQPPRTLKEAVVGPLVDFFKRPGIFEVVVFLLIYKLDAVVAMALHTPFLMELGFERTEIGAIAKSVGLVSSIVGVLTGGVLLVKWGIQRSLWVCGLLQALAGGSFIILAQLGRNFPAMVTANIIENFTSGMGNAAYSAFMMTLCNPRFTATQFALVTSIMAVTRTVAGAPTGWLAKAVGWEWYFAISVLIGIPGLLLLTRYKRWNIEQTSL